MEFLRRMTELINKALIIPDLNLRIKALETILEQLRGATVPIHGGDHDPIADKTLRDFCEACGRLIDPANQTVGRVAGMLYENTIGTLIRIVQAQVDSLRDLNSVKNFLKDKPE